MLIQIEPSSDFFTAIRDAIREEVMQVVTASNVDTQLMTTDNAAEFMQVSVQTIRQFMRQGLPHFQSGQVIRFLRSDIIEWMKTKGEKSA
jgi:excisionase family DNA binding protein